MGWLFKQRTSRFWWAKYYVDGRLVRASTGTTSETEARRILKTWEGQAAAGLPVLPRADRIRYEEAAEDLRDHYRATRARQLWEAEARFAHLGRFFTGWRIAAIDQAAARRYALRRQAQGAANATINRELALLIRMLRLAYEGGKLLRLPVIRKLKEAPPRLRASGVRGRPAGAPARPPSRGGARLRARLAVPERGADVGAQAA